MDVFRTWDAKVFVLGRTNALNTFLCKIKDGFFPEEQGYPVYENGTKATNLGIMRRRGEVNVLAYVNLSYARYRTSNRRQGRVVSLIFIFFCLLKGHYSVDSLYIMSVLGSDVRVCNRYNL